MSPKRLAANLLSDAILEIGIVRAEFSPEEMQRIMDKCIWIANMFDAKWHVQADSQGEHHAPEGYGDLRIRQRNEVFLQGVKSGEQDLREQITGELVHHAIMAVSSPGSTHDYGINSAGAIRHYETIAQKLRESLS